MDVLKSLQEKNPHIQIIPVTYTAFLKYGQVHNDVKVDGLINSTLEYVNMSDKVVSYEASVPQLESDADLMLDIQKKVYGEMPIQVGVCYGWNTKLNGLEYHKGSEFLVAATDLVLLLGDLRDINFSDSVTYDTSKVEAFFVKAGTAVELYASALHYAPVHVKEEDGFVAVIVLPTGTNQPLQNKIELAGENRLLLAKNKWLVVHPDAAKDEYVGLVGANTEINPL